jgi:Peptidase M50B-like
MTFTNICAPANGNKYEASECLPDACGNEIREERLMKRQCRDDDRNVFRRALERDRNLIIACVVLIVLMNISTGRYVLYPFMIFSTWVHEMCHGMTAILMGGSVYKLAIFKDGSGYAVNAVPGRAWRSGVVSSAGYPGTAITGCILLLYRRTTLGPTIGTIGLGIAIVLSCIILVRNVFGFLMLGGEGVFLLLAAWLFPAAWLDNLYNFLAATCCLNAVDSIQDLFASSQGYVNGEEMQSDAHSVAEKWGFDYRFWAMLWLIMSFVATVIGVVFARDARELSWNKPTTTNGNDATVTTAPDIEASSAPYTAYLT